MLWMQFVCIAVMYGIGYIPGLISSIGVYPYSLYLEGVFSTFLSFISRVLCLDSRRDTLSVFQRGGDMVVARSILICIVCVDPAITSGSVSVAA